MQARRHLKLAVICTVALAVPASAATAGLLDVPPSKKAHTIHRDVCPINNPDYTGPKPARR